MQRPTYAPGNWECDMSVDAATKPPILRSRAFYISNSFGLSRPSTRSLPVLRAPSSTVSLASYLASHAPDPFLPCARVRANLHVVLCFSPVGDAFRSRCRKFPGLTNCTQIDLFRPWPRDALVKVSLRFLEDMALGDVEVNPALHGGGVEIDRWFSERMDAVAYPVGSCTLRGGVCRTFRARIGGTRFGAFSMHRSRGVEPAEGERHLLSRATSAHPGRKKNTTRCCLRSARSLTICRCPVFLSSASYQSLTTLRNCVFVACLDYCR